MYEHISITNIESILWIGRFILIKTVKIIQEKKEHSGFGKHISAKWATFNSFYIASWKLNQKGIIAKDYL